MLNPKERFELFLSYIKDRGSLSPEQIQRIEQRLKNCPAYTSHYESEGAERIIQSKIFKDGQIKASVNPPFKVLPVGNLECFLTQILLGLGQFRTTWLTQFREDIAADLQNRFSLLLLDWAFLKRKLLDYNLMRKDRKFYEKEKRLRPQKDKVEQELVILNESVLLKIPNHKFPKESIEFLEEIKKDNEIDHLIYLFKTNIPQLNKSPMAHRISELLEAFDITAKPETIRQRMTRSKTQSE